MTETEELRAIFAKSLCQCGKAKRRVLLCAECMRRLPGRLRHALREVELSGALVSFYREALEELAK